MEFKEETLYGKKQLMVLTNKKDWIGDIVFDTEWKFYPQEETSLVHKELLEINNKLEELNKKGEGALNFGVK